MKKEKEIRLVGVDIRPWETNLQPAAVEILKTLLLLDKNYGINKLARILRGEKSKYAETDPFAELETHGALPRYSHFELRLIIEIMALKGFLEPTDSDFSTIEITEKGRNYLDDPGTLIVDTIEVSFTVSEIFLLRKFTEFRKGESEKQDIFPYELFNDFTVDRLVKEKPKNLKHLRLIPGMTHEKAETLGPMILGILKESQSNWEAIRLSEIARKCKHSTHVSVLEKYQKGHEVEEIGRLMNLAEITVKLYLCDYHQMGVLDMRREIETWMPKEELHRAAEYFRNVARPRISEASRTLGMDPLIVQICQAYAAEVPELKTATA